MRGGERLFDAAGPQNTSGASQRLTRLIEQAVTGQPLVEGLEYAKLGQTKRITFGPGLIEGIVQGRNYRPYTTTLRVDVFDPPTWEKVVAAMSDQALYAAKLLAGELPPNIEDIFAPLGLKLCPTEPPEIKPSCTCTDAAANPGSWCKHACCVAMLAADRLARDSYLIFTLRGLSSEELLERLRQRRTVLGAAGGGGAVAVYQPRSLGIGDVRPLEQTIATFWDVGPELREIDAPLDGPQVSHPLLRRLGPSPFQGPTSRFPLVGLLATCYEIASEAAKKSAEPPPPRPIETIVESTDPEATSG